jgi:hypothetical protein
MHLYMRILGTGGAGFTLSRLSNRWISQDRKDREVVGKGTSNGVETTMVTRQTPQIDGGYSGHL